MTQVEIISDMIKELTYLSNDDKQSLEDNGANLRAIMERMITFALNTNSNDYIDYGIRRDNNFALGANWQEVKTKLLSALKQMRDRAQLTQDLQQESNRQQELLQKQYDLQSAKNNISVHNELSHTKKEKPIKNDKIFIVHGHENEMKLAVARSIEKLGLEAIILHEQPSKGRTIIEKIEGNSDVGFAVVLLSPDDFGYAKDDKPENTKLRARQNVILELGYFLGKLGRNHVVAIYMPQINFEMPSDFNGVLYIPFDNAGRWQFDLVKELKACGYKVDANKLLN